MGQPIFWPFPIPYEYRTIVGEVPLQRLFSTFANGWPGVGLLLQRLVTGSGLLYFVVTQHRTSSGCASFMAETLDAGAAILLIIGLWTPIVGAAIAAIQVWIIFSGSGDAWIPTVLAALGATLAMIGPGAWSVDCRTIPRVYPAVSP